MISDEILSKYYSYVDVSLNAKNYGRKGENQSTDGSSTMEPTQVDEREGFSGRYETKGYEMTPLKFLAAFVQSPNAVYINL